MLLGKESEENVALPSSTVIMNVGDLSCTRNESGLHGKTEEKIVTRVWRGVQDLPIKNYCILQRNMAWIMPSGQGTSKI